jgi:peptidoglycan/xylan/chitin deacetylase (PgdA/CDA1 family)
MNLPFRIVVFTGSLSWDVIATLRGILDDNPGIELLILHHSPNRPMRRLIHNQIKNAKKHGWRWIPYQVREIASRARYSMKPARLQPGLNKHIDLRSHPNITLETVPSINSRDVGELLRRWQPDLGLSIASPILKEPLFAIPRLGTVNIHKGRLPHYRGMPPAFWEIWNRERTVGVTVHRVEKGLDTGAILLDDEVPIEQYSTPAGLRVRLDAVGIDLMRRAVKQARTGEAVFRPQVGEGHTYTRPTLAQERELARRYARADARRLVKRCVFAAYTAMARLRTENAPYIVVLLYHRVSDRMRDAVTIGVEQFETHIRFLADHYKVMRLDDIIFEDIRIGDNLAVAVSFDDGYLDNYENAAPVLAKYGVPATFFISTENISRNVAFEHDLHKLGYGLPNMSWDQIREMQKEGFSFGSHTANHINLAQVDARVAQEELLQSKATLERELKAKQIMFAYPFGKRADITPERLRQIESAGYICNCSAYGGINRLPVDRWDIRRQGINHEFDISALAARIAGWKSSVFA